MKNLFIDTNIWLSLYHFSNDDLSEFEKLKEYLGKAIKLYFPEQVWDEFLRNREVKLIDALSKFTMQPLQHPTFCKGYEGFNDFVKNYKILLKSYNGWIDTIKNQIESRKLPADITIDSILQSIEFLDCAEYVERAFMRYKRGNPPGKDNKYGDAINWECLLQCVPNGEDLYFVSGDKDYSSVISKDQFNPFLLDEWKKKKHSKIYFYKSLSSFFKDNITDIKLTIESEKQELINKLHSSDCFITTHGIIAMLNKYTEWTENQIEDMCYAAETNSQVGWILSDSDVCNFYCKLFSSVKYDELDDCSTKRIIKHFIREHILEDSRAQKEYEIDEDNTADGEECFYP